MEAVEEAFEFFDADQLQALTYDQFDTMARSLGETPYHTTLRELFDAHSDDQNRISIDQVKSIWGEVTKVKVGENDLLQALKQFDARGRGWISKHQFTRMLRDVGSIKVPAEQLKYAQDHAAQVSLEFSQTADAPDWCKPEDGKTFTRDVDGNEGYHIESLTKWMYDV
eukprot:TRINITY_DN4345_c0_g1_i1.p1 TRINITY_DN4345_c0_g1~~TRINITY_DN4345_c0_g1_i1.p1  ORF type:complete len:168 (-),score=49.69 TRINITY_DN4345_c0_g1_i1:322-825(-)